MKHAITIAKSKNGWLVINRELSCVEHPKDMVPSSWTFNSLEKAIAQIRILMKEQRQNLP